MILYSQSVANRSMADFMRVGDAVSAKFRGAMCGAVVIKVDPVLLCRVRAAASLYGILLGTG